MITSPYDPPPRGNWHLVAPRRPVIDQARDDAERQVRFDALTPLVREEIQLWMLARHFSRLGTHTPERRGRPRWPEAWRRNNAWELV
jgi:hypothetical protein